MSVAGTVKWLLSVVSATSNADSQVLLVAAVNRLVHSALTPQLGLFLRNPFLKKSSSFEAVERAGGGMAVYW